MPRSIIIALTLLPSACFAPDVDRLEHKMIEECKTAPEGPACASLNPEGAKDLVRRFAETDVRDAAVQNCILAVDCSDARMKTDPQGATLEIVQCTGLDQGPTLPGLTIGAVDAACQDACLTALEGCGGPASCSPDVVDQCFAENDTCLHECPP